MPAVEVERAVGEVLASAVAPAAAAHAGGARAQLGAPPVAVLVHGWRDGDRRGARPGIPARPGSRPSSSPGRDRRPIGCGSILEAAVRTLAVRHGAIEIEWVANGDQVTFLQLRPYRAPPPPRPWPPAGELPPGLDWRWDAAHNPLPLTPAQAGLVALVDAAGGTGFRQHVAGGYLSWAPGGTPARPRPSPRPPSRPSSRAIEREADAALAALGPTPALEAALATFAAFYPPIYGLLRPALHRARAALRAPLAARPTWPIPVLLPDPARRRAVAGQPAPPACRRDCAAASPGERQRAVDAYLAASATRAPSGTSPPPPTGSSRTPSPIACRTSRPAETPPPDWRAAAQQVRSRLPSPLHAVWDATLTSARAAAAAAEDDDWIYARLQAAVRRALLALGDRLTATARLARRDDVFYLPLATARALAAERTGARCRALAAAGRAAFAAALRDPPPLPRDAGPGLGAGAGAPGQRHRGRALGRVHHHDPAGPPPPADAVLVATTLLPTELPLLRVGGAGHRRRAGPWTTSPPRPASAASPPSRPSPAPGPGLRPGDLVLVDADAGLVIPARDRSPWSSHPSSGWKYAIRPLPAPLRSASSGPGGPAEATSRGMDRCSVSISSCGPSLLSRTHARARLEGVEHGRRGAERGHDHRPAGERSAGAGGSGPVR